MAATAPETPAPIVRGLAIVGLKCRVTRRAVALKRLSAKTVKATVPVFLYELPALLGAQQLVKAHDLGSGLGTKFVFVPSESGDSL